MIALFTDFGLSGPYVGQMKAVLAVKAPGVPVIDLFADAPAFDPCLSAYLLAAYADSFPAGTVFLCVVDPGVGGKREPVLVQADGRFFVGPGNGLFEIVLRRGRDVRTGRIVRRPARLSATFHGRDLFAPMAADLAVGRQDGIAWGEDVILRFRDWPDDLARLIYFDAYGNAMTGLRAATLGEDTVLRLGSHRIRRARTFGEVPEGAPLWYENADGLAEIAVNRGSAKAVLGLVLGQDVGLLTAP